MAVRSFEVSLSPSSTVSSLMIARIWQVARKALQLEFAAGKLSQLPIPFRLSGGYRCASPMIGGTGVVGRCTVNSLRRAGHETIELLAPAASTYPRSKVLIKRSWESMPLSTSPTYKRVTRRRRGSSLEPPLETCWRRNSAPECDTTCCFLSLHRLP
jgi:hypothetical protein